MAPTVLLVATATRWLGTARIPRDFARAGWSVSVLAPKGTLAEHSRHVKKIGHLPDNATPRQWAYAFAATVQATAPRLVLPCDDTAFHLLHQLAVAPPDRMQPVLHLRLATLIADSLGDPAHFGPSVDKTLICGAAEAAGVRVPQYQAVADPGEASAFAAAHGWPVVLKRSHSTAGDGVAICADQATLTREFVRLAKGSTRRLGESGPVRLVVQAHIPGRTRYFAGTAWRGALLCGYAADKLAGEPKGAASVVRYFHSPELQESAARLASAFGASGIFAPEYIVHERSGEPYLLEVNRRLTPGTHRGEFFNMSSGAALHAALEGRPAGTRARLDDGEERVFVSFPHEWLRPREPVFARVPRRRALGRAGTHRGDAGDEARTMTRRVGYPKRPARRRICGLALATAALHCAGRSAPILAADPPSYPNRPIHLIVPFAPGNQLDVFARLVGGRLADSLGQPVIVENRPGVAGNAASEAVAKAAPDGYSLLVSGVLITLLPLTYGPLAVDPVAAFAPITRMAQQPIVIAANASLNVDSIADLIALARAAPGKIAYATSGIGTAQHVAMTMLSQRAGIMLLHVPYANSGQLIADVLSGIVPVAVSFPGTIEPHRRTGRLKALAVTSAHRALAWPDVPTVAESGFPNFDVLSWAGVLAPAGTPPEIVERLHREIVRILDIPEVRVTFLDQSAEPVGNTPEQFAAEIRASVARWTPVVKAAGIKVD